MGWTLAKTIKKSGTTKTSKKADPTVSEEEYQRRVKDGKIITEFITKQKANADAVHCPHFMELKWANGCHYDCAWCYLKGTYYGQTNFREKSWSEIFDVLAKVNNELKEPCLLNAGELSDGFGGETETDSSALLILA